jgi:ribonucleoside-diphosphate reductase alpha chain
MATRQRLPNRRIAETRELELNGLPFTVTFGQHPDGRILEIFLQNHKPGSQSDANARDAAVAASLALQFGCPLEVLQRALLRDSHGRPSTPLGAALDIIAGEGTR